MNEILSIDSASRDDLIDFILHAGSLAFLVVLASSLLGLFLGWLIWRNCRKQSEEIERDNRQLREEIRRLDQTD